MAKVKTHKTTAKRIRVTKRGKLLKRHIRIGHLRAKQSSKKKRRKGQMEHVSKGRRRRVKELLGKR